MRTRTRAYGGGDAKMNVAKLASSKTSIAKMKNKLKSNTSTLKKELKSLKVNQKLVLKGKRVTKTTKSDLKDRKVFSQSFVEISPMNSLQLASFAKGSKADASVKKESADKKSITSEKSSIKQSRRSRSLSRKADQRSPTVSPSASKKSPAKSPVKVTATRSPKSPASAKSKISPKGGVKRRSESAGSTTKKAKSADEALKMKSKLPKRMSKSPQKSDKKVTGEVAVASEKSAVERKKSPGREAKTSRKSLVMTTDSSVVKTTDNLSMLVRPSLLSDSKMNKKHVSLGDSSVTAGQKRRRVTDTFEIKAAEVQFREPESKRVLVSQTTRVVTSISSTDRNKSKQAPTARVIASSISSEESDSTNTQAILKTSVVETPLTSLPHQKTREESASVVQNYVVKPSTSAGESSSIGIGNSGEAGLLSPERRGVWEIEGRKSTLLEKLWSWSPTSAFKFRKTEVRGGTLDDKEITSGFSYREDHFDKDVSAALSTGFVKSMEEVRVTSSQSTTGVSTRCRDISVKGAADKLLSADLKKDSNLARSGLLLSAAEPPVKSRGLVTRKCVTCTVVSVFTCAVFGVLAMLSLSYVYT